MAKTDNPYVGPEPNLNAVSSEGIPVTFMIPNQQASEAKAWNEGYAAARADMTPVVEALQKCAEQFDWYAGLHAAKGPEGAEKAARNRDFAVTCRVALASIQESE